MPKKDLFQYFVGANPNAIDLLSLMLEIDSEKRITAEKALAHPYLAAYADPLDEPTSEPFDQSEEMINYPVEKWRGMRNLLGLSLVIIALCTAILRIKLSVLLLN